MNDNDYADSISVIGMAGRFPDAPDVETLWHNIMAGHNAIRPLTAEELDAADPGLRNDPNHVAVTAAVTGVEFWDATFFGFSPRAAEVTDPQHRLFLECCWQAMENAGYDPTGYPGVAGIIAGSGFPTYLQSNIMGHWDVIAEAGHLQLAIGNDRDSLSTMVAYKLNLRGPSFTVQTACSTSMLAVHLACNSLLTFESDLMLAGGVAIQTPQSAGYVYEEGGILAPDGVVRSLDAKGKGGVFGNGAAVVVLKRTADAVRDGDQIYAQILGSATNNDGVARAGYAAPGLRGQTEVIVEALSNADVDADTVSYIEAHGTGTLLGDAVELDAVSRGFLPRDPAAGVCTIGSVKSNIGHADRASGVIGLIKTALMLHHEKIPPQVNFDSPNPNLDLSSGAFRVVTEPTTWPSGGKPRRAVVNSFGMGGTNAVAVLQEAPRLEYREPGCPAAQVLVLSARTPSALEAATSNLRHHLASRPDLELSDVAFTLQTGRTAFNFRRVLVCADLAEAVAGLAEPQSPPARTAHQTRRERPVVLAVPGEDLDAKQRELGRALYESEPVLREAFAQCAGALGLGVEQVWTASCAGPVLRYALARLLLSVGVRADRFVGVGSGARVAAALAGTLPLTVLADDSEPADDRTPAGQAEAAALSADEDLVLVELGDGRLLRAWDTGNPRNDDGSRLAVLASVRPEQASTAVREVIGRLWLAGAEPNWAALHAGRPVRRVALPTYPFERQRLWLDPAPDGIALPRSDQRHEDIGQWFYAPVWRLAPRLVPAVLDARLVEAGPWLIVGSEETAAPAETLRSRLTGAGAEVTQVTLDGAGTRSDVRLGASHPRTVIHVGATADSSAGVVADPAGRVRTVLTGFDRAQQVGFDSVRLLVGALVGRAGADPPRVLMLTRAAVQVLGDEPMRPAHAGLIGLARVVPQENPGMQCRVVDIGRADICAEPGESGSRLADEILADAIDTDPTTVAYRGDQRWCQDYEPFPIPQDGGSAVLRNGGTYLLTGGLGQVCLALAEHLAATYQARLALIARSPLPDESHWDRWLADHPATDRTSARIRRVRALRDAGADVMVVAADVADAGQLTAAIETVRARFGEPHGVIHGAGVQADEFFGLAHELSADQCREHYRAKVFGLAAIAEALDLDRLDFCITLSSLATVLGAIGHAPYAAANAAMDGLAQALFAAGHRRLLTVDWDSWPSGAQVAGLGGSATVAKYRMSYAEGIQAVERALGAVGALPRLVNSTGDLRPRLQAWVNDQHAEHGSGDGQRHPRPPLDTPFVAPADDLEREIAEVWQDVMGLAGIGVLDNFFELGGHSLMAVRLIGRIRKSAGTSVPIAVLAECPTVRQLAAKVVSLRSSPQISATGGRQCSG